jgi:DNA-binding GntR family transcriptional regulator
VDTVVNTSSATDDPGGTGAATSFAEHAYRVIRDRLIMLDIPPGAPINDMRLAQTLGLGRTPVREALKRLETERLVVAFPRRGTFATEVNITDLAHLSEVRLQLEPMAAGTAARRATQRDRTALQVLLDELESGSRHDDPGAMLRLDLRVHRAVYASTQNPYLEETLVRYDNLATRIWSLFLERLPGVAGHVEEHGQLLRAIVAGEEKAASKLASAHVAGFERAVRAAM